MNFEQIKEFDEAYLAKTYARYPVAFKGGEGATLTGVDGRQYIDFGAGIAVNIFGANDKEWKKAVKTQIDKISHVSNYYYSEPQCRLAELIAERTGARRVFFSNSGGEANECALKAARKYSYVKYGAGRNKIVSLKGSFHGRTLFTVTATGQDEFHRYFDPFVSGVDYAEANMQDIRRVTQNACAVIIECVQGEGGVKALEPQFVKSLEAYCKEQDILLVIDEVQSGNGRTGKLYSYEHYGITPDIVTTAKGLGGGLPIGATLFFAKTEHVLSPGDHGSTFGGNPIVCAGAYSVLSRLSEEFLLEVQGKSEYFRAKLRAIPGVSEVTGLGLMIGLKTAKPAKEVVAACLKRGLLVLSAHDLVRLLPPLNITKTETDEGLTILREVLEA